MPHRRKSRTLTQEQQRQCLTLLASTWSRLNENLLGAALTPPLFHIDEQRARLGSWTAKTRTLTISLGHLVESTWLEVEATLRHEMAHQFVCEAWGEPDAQPHGALFQRALALLEADQRWSPNQEGSNTDEKHQRVLDRVEKLLALGSSSNPNEADAALIAASRLMLKYNLDSVQSGTAPDFGFVWLGAPTGRIATERKVIAGLVQRLCKVQCIWVRSFAPAKGASVFVLEALGRRESLELAHYTHDALSRVVNELWEGYRAQIDCPTKRRQTRRSYRLGVLLGFEEKLDAAEQTEQEDGLVWLGDPELGAYWEKRHPRVQKLRAGNYFLDDAHKRGRKDGRSLSIKKAILRKKARTPKALIQA